MPYALCLMPQSKLVVPEAVCGPLAASGTAVYRYLKASVYGPCAASASLIEASRFRRGFALRLTPYALCLMPESKLGIPEAVALDGEHYRGVGV